MTPYEQEIQLLLVREKLQETCRKNVNPPPTCRGQKQKNADLGHFQWFHVSDLKSMSIFYIQSDKTNQISL